MPVSFSDAVFLVVLDPVLPEVLLSIFLSPCVVVDTEGITS